MRTVLAAEATGRKLLQGGTAAAAAAAAASSITVSSVRLPPSIFWSDRSVTGTLHMSIVMQGFDTTAHGGIRCQYCIMLHTDTHAALHPTLVKSGSAMTAE